MSLFHCSYLIYKTITKWFSKLDSVIHALGMLLDFRKAEKYTACGVEYFYAVRKSRDTLVHGILYSGVILKLQFRC
jgi:hypothetical protein